MTRTFSPTLRASSPTKLTTEQLDGNWTGISEIANSASRSYAANSESAMFALQPPPVANDSCWRTDVNKPYVFLGGDAARIDNWRTIPASTMGSAHDALSVVVVAESGEQTGSVDLGRYFDVQKEVSTAAGRLRLYRDATARDADLSRPVTTADASAAAGCILEDVFVAGALTIEWRDVPAHAGPDGLVYWAWAGDTGATITLSILVKE